MTLNYHCTGVVELKNLYHSRDLGRAIQLVGENARSARYITLVLKTPHQFAKSLSFVEKLLGNLSKKSVKLRGIDLDMEDIGWIAQGF